MLQKELLASNCTDIEELIAEDFGEEGSAEREAFEMECDAFIIGEKLKDERKKLGLTQSELATRIGTKKSFISRVEHGYADIQLSTLNKLFNGVGKSISIAVL